MSLLARKWKQTKQVRRLIKARLEIADVEACSQWGWPISPTGSKTGEKIVEERRRYESRGLSSLHRADTKHAAEGDPAVIQACLAAY